LEGSWGEQTLYQLLCICVNPVSRRIGPYDLTLGILNPDNNMIARTVTDNLFHQGTIQKNQVAVSFVPTNSIPTVNGELTFGGVDSTKLIGELDYL
jgi:cathepsin E